MSRERELQKSYGTEERAQQFYNRQMRSSLNDMMQRFLVKRDMLFVSTADAEGNCDSSIRVGAPGFIRVLDEKRIAYPEYRGNGVYASLGNIVENHHIVLLTVDFYDTTVGLHVNGKASIVDSLPECEDPLAERWVLVEVEEAYIQCSKHIPKLQPTSKKIAWNTDDEREKGGDFFQCSTPSES